MIRHGEIPSNVNRIYAGTSTEGLTEKGVVQAEEVSWKLLDYNVDAIYSSPVQRALQTAEIIKRSIDTEILIRNEFREMEMGSWEGLSEEYIAGCYPDKWHTWNTRPAELRINGRETLDELQGRVLKGIQRIYMEDANRTVVIVTHVAIIRVVMLWYQKKSLNLYKTINVPNADIFKIVINNI